MRTPDSKIVFSRCQETQGNNHGGTGKQAKLELLLFIILYHPRIFGQTAPSVRRRHVTSTTHNYIDKARGIAKGSLSLYCTQTSVQMTYHEFM